MSKVEAMEERVHGRPRDLDDSDDLRLGVHDSILYARNRTPVEGAQWTGIVTRIAIEMLESGAVDAVVCVQSADDDRCAAFVSLILTRSTRLSACSLLTTTGAPPSVSLLLLSCFSLVSLFALPSSVSLVRRFGFLCMHTSSHTDSW